MKNTIKNSIQRRLEDETYESEELQDLLYARWVLRREENEKKEAIAREELWKLFFCGNLCFLHDREWCRECAVYGEGRCPSTREECTLPHDF